MIMIKLKKIKNLIRFHILCKYIISNFISYEGHQMNKGKGKNTKLGKRP